MRTIALSEAVLAVLLLQVERGELPVDDSNRELHRELASLINSDIQYVD
jgi:hypothetical protein